MLGLHPTYLRLFKVCCKVGLKILALKFCFTRIYLCVFTIPKSYVHRVCAQKSCLEVPLQAFELCSLLLANAIRVGTSCNTRLSITILFEFGQSSCLLYWRWLLLLFCHLGVTHFFLKMSFVFLEDGCLVRGEGQILDSSAHVKHGSLLHNFVAFPFLGV